MKGALKAAMIVGILSTLSGCLYVELKTNKEESYHEQVGKLVVFVDAGSSETFGAPFVERLGGYLTISAQKKFQANGLDCRCFRESGLGLLEEHQIKKQLDKIPLEGYEPDHILSIAFRQPAFVEYKVIVDGTFDVTLFDVALQQNVWRATLYAMRNSRWGMSNSDLDTLVDDIVRAMQKDGLIKP